MKDWKKLGDWLTQNAGQSVALIGSLLTGNVPSAIALGSSLIAKATGNDDPDIAMEVLKQRPETMVRLKELALEQENTLRDHFYRMRELELQDASSEHRQTQETIRNGDSSPNPEAAKVRPWMAMWSFLATLFYIFLFELLEVFYHGQGSSLELVILISAPAWAYMGLRTLDKRSFFNLTKGKNDVK